MRKLRWGILGTARIATQSMAPAIAASANGAVVAVASRDKSKAAAAAAKLGVGASYGSYEELLADSSVDAVYVPLPVSMHAEWSIRAAKAGKHVLCEKPLSANAAEARTMAEAFAARKLLLMEGFMYRFHPVTVKVKSMVDAGEVGEVRTIRASFAAGNDDDSDIRMKPEMGGGAMRDVGCYCVNLMRLITGQEPVTVSAVAHIGPKSGVDESVAGALLFPSGVTGSFGCSFRSQYDSSSDIVGSKGRILVDLGGMCHWPGTEFSIKHWKGDAYQEIVCPAANHYTLLAEEFGEAVLSGRPPKYPISDTIANMDVIDRVIACF
jgi:predicted dehydrogenase